MWPIPQVLKVGKSNLVSRVGGWLGTWGGDRQAVSECRRQLGTATNHADHCWTTPITNPTFRSSGKALSIAKNFPKSRSTLFLFCKSKSIVKDLVLCEGWDVYICKSLRIRPSKFGIINKISGGAGVPWDHIIYWNLSELCILETSSSDLSLPQKNIPHARISNVWNKMENIKLTNPPKRPLLKYDICWNISEGFYGKLLFRTLFSWIIEILIHSFPQFLYISGHNCAFEPIEISWQPLIYLPGLPFDLVHINSYFGSCSYHPIQPPDLLLMDFRVRRLFSWIELIKEFQQSIEKLNRSNYVFIGTKKNSTLLQPLVAETFSWGCNFSREHRKKLLDLCV